MIANNYDQIGRTIAPDVAKQVPPVGIALDQLEKELHGIRESIMLLEQRLCVVVRPTPVPSSDKLSTGSIGGSPLTNQLESLIFLARTTNADVRTVIDSLEI